MGLGGGRTTVMSHRLSVQTREDSATVCHSFVFKFWFTQISGKGSP